MSTYYRVCNVTALHNKVAPIGSIHVITHNQTQTNRIIRARTHVHLIKNITEIRTYLIHIKAETSTIPSKLTHWIFEESNTRVVSMPLA